MNTAQAEKRNAENKNGLETIGNPKELKNDKQGIEYNPIRPGDIKPIAMLHNHWATVVPAEINPEDLSEQAFWMFMANRFMTGDEITVTADNMSWRAYCIVTSAQNADIRVRVRDIIELDASTEREIEIGTYLIRNQGMIKRYTVTRKKDGKVLKEGLPTMIEAMKYATEQIQANR